VSHGKGLDYSVCHIIDVTKLPYKQVATYRSNTVLPKDYASILNSLGRYYNYAYMLVENNDIGAQITHQLWNEFEYENVVSSTNKGRAGKVLSIGVPRKSDIGIRMTSGVKVLGCSVLKMLVEQGQLEIVDKDTIGELNTFSKRGSSYAAEEGKHDDCVMPLVSFAWMTTTPLFKELTDTNAIGETTDYSEDQLAKSILLAGIKVDGIEEPPEKKVVRFGGELWEEVDKSWGNYSGASIF
jgi:hypothetical protein